MLLFILKILLHIDTVAMDTKTIFPVHLTVFTGIIPVRALTFLAAISAYPDKFNTFIPVLVPILYESAQFICDNRFVSPPPFRNLILFTSLLQPVRAVVTSTKTVYAVTNLFI